MNSSASSNSNKTSTRSRVPTVRQNVMATRSAPQVGDETVEAGFQPQMMMMTPEQARRARMENLSRILQYVIDLTDEDLENF